MKTMETQIKFTSDGKKVVVVGKLNNTETIVQEIFIVDGNEIPSGENFVVKSLHDSPAKSWKETELERLNAHFETEKKRIESETSRWQRAGKESVLLMKERVSYLRKFATDKSNNVLDRIESFLSGEIRYCITSGYTPELKELCASELVCSHYPDSMRLVSLFGNDDGSMTWGINKYRDGSGNDKNIFFCKTKDEAIEVLKNEVADSIKRYGLQDGTLKICVEYSIKIDDAVLGIYKDKKTSDFVKNIEQYKKSIGTWEAEIEKINSL